MISHDTISLTTPDTFVFVRISGISCSICAPASMTASDVERFANEQGPPPSEGRWFLIDKATLGMGTPTPNRCNQVDGRMHWFLLSKEATDEMMWQ